MMTKAMVIDGVVSRVDGDMIDEDVFWTELTGYFDSKGYAFGGSIDAYGDEDEEGGDHE